MLPAMAEAFQHIILTREGGVATLALNHPEVMNATSPALIGGAMAALDAVEADPSVRVLILTGEGKAFCSGANLNETGGGLDTGGMLEKIYHPFLRRLRDLKFPIVTAVNGPAVGIGLSIALMGDLVLAARSSYFLCSFARIGLVPDGGATWILPRLIGLARARQMALTAEPVSAEQALDWGMITAVTNDDTLRAEALGLAQRLAMGPASQALTRKLLWESFDRSYEDQLAAEQAAQTAAGQTADFKEGLGAFHMKRFPHFTGK